MHALHTSTDQWLCMNLPNRNIICSIPPGGPDASWHLMVVLLNWLALSVAVVVTLRVKLLVMLTSGFAAVTTAVAPVAGSTLWENIAPSVLAYTILAVNKLFFHSSTAPWPKQEHIISSFVHSLSTLLPGHCPPVTGWLAVLCTWHDKSTVAVSKGSKVTTNGTKMHTTLLVCVFVCGMSIGFKEWIWLVNRSICLQCYADTAGADLGGRGA